MEATELFDRAGAYVSLVSLLGLVLLLPLYLSQRRDIRRLRFWHGREPEHPDADIVASEAMLDRAETELEELLAEPEEAAATPADGIAAATPATRVTSERPALTRITMERAALEPHPRWRRFAGRATQPRILLSIGLAALLLGAAGIFVSEQLLSGDGEGRPARAGAVDPSQVTVAVLNGTSVNGLAGKVASDVKANGFQLGAVTNTAPGFERTVVMYSQDQKPAAQRVARDLGVGQVERLGREERAAAGDADVVVIAGEDRARP